LKERGEMFKSITDYILYLVELGYVFKYVKVIRGAELSTDHRLLVTDMRFRKGLLEKTKKYQKLFTEKLRREETQEECQKNLEYKLASMTRQEGYENWNLDDTWTIKLLLRAPAISPSFVLERRGHPSPQNKLSCKAVCAPANAARPSVYTQ
jgi:hypothetical protein